MSHSYGVQTKGESRGGQWTVQQDVAATLAVCETKKFTMATMCKHGDNSPHHRRNSREEDVTHQTSDHAGTLANRSSIRTEKHFIYLFF